MKELTLQALQNIESFIIDDELVVHKTTELEQKLANCDAIDVNLHLLDDRKTSLSHYLEYKAHAELFECYRDNACSSIKNALEKLYVNDAFIQMVFSARLAAPLLQDAVIELSTLSAEAYTLGVAQGDITKFLVEIWQYSEAFCNAVCYKAKCQFLLMQEVANYPELYDHLIAREIYQETLIRKIKPLNSDDSAAAFTHKYKQFISKISQMSLDIAKFTSTQQQLGSLEPGVTL